MKKDEPLDASLVSKVDLIFRNYHLTRYPGFDAKEVETKPGFYLLSQVEEIEASEGFVRYMAENPMRFKKAPLLEQIGRIPVDVPVFEWDDLVERSRRFHNAREVEKAKRSFLWEWPLYPWCDERRQVERMCVDFLRHGCAGHARELEKVVGSDGVDDAGDEIALIVLEAIGDAYPQLQHECDFQADSRHEIGPLVVQQSSTEPGEYWESSIRTIPRERLRPATNG